MLLPPAVCLGEQEEALRLLRQASDHVSTFQSVSNQAALSVRFWRQMAQLLAMLDLDMRSGVTCWQVVCPVIMPGFLLDARIHNRIDLLP